MIERGDPLFALRERPVQVIRKPKHVLIVIARTLILRKMQIIIERVTRCLLCASAPLKWSQHVSITCKSIDLDAETDDYRTGDPLFAHKLSALFLTRWTLTSEYLDCHIQLWNTLKALVFVNSLRRSRTTLTDKIFNTIYDKTKPTTHLVKKSKRWLRTSAM